MIDWTSETWGQVGHNVHEDSHGSWLEDWRDSGAGDPS